MGASSFLRGIFVDLFDTCRPANTMMHPKPMKTINILEVACLLLMHLRSQPPRGSSWLGFTLKG